MVADLNRFKEILEKGEVKNALFVLPQNPSLDLVASALSLKLSLAKKGISSVISCPTPMTVEVNRLVGVDQVREDLGDKNLILTFADYLADNIERVAYNIEGGQFNLTIVPKPGQVAPNQDQIVTKYAGIGADLIFIVGANYPGDLGAFADVKELTEKPENLVLFGNEPLGGWPKGVELIDVTASSASEVALEIIQETGFEFDEDTATNLFLGIENGTQNFTSGAVNAQTFSRAAELLGKGARRNLPAAPQAPQFPSRQKSDRPSLSQQEATIRDSANIG